MRIITILFVYDRPETAGWQSEKEKTICIVANEIEHHNGKNQNRYLWESPSGVV